MHYSYTLKHITLVPLISVTSKQRLFRNKYHKSYSFKWEVLFETERLLKRFIVKLKGFN